MGDREQHDQSHRCESFEPLPAAADRSKDEGHEERNKNGSEKTDRAERGCPPPDEPIMVYCLHCGKEYMSSEMIPPSGGKGGLAARTPIMMEGMWWCATPGCNAGGFGLDVFPVDPEWKDPKGLLEIHTDSDDDEEFEWDDDDDL